MNHLGAEIESSIMERLMISPEAAKGVLSMRFTPHDEARMCNLLDKNNKGTITDAERAELEGYRRVGNLLGILQARARIFLKQTGNGA